MNLDIKPGGRLEKQTSQVTIDAPARLEKQTPQINIDAPAFLPKAIIRALVIYVLWTTQMFQVPIQLSFMRLHRDSERCSYMGYSGLEIVVDC